MSNQPFEVQPRRLGAQVVEAISRAEIDIQIATANAYPRTISRCIEKMIEVATKNDEIAASCFYHIPRDGKTISGPSVALARIVASSWKHIRAASRIVDEGDKHIVAQATCHDLENNVAISREVRVRITRKDGTRYNEDMIATTANAACSKALRSAIFDIVPVSVIGEVVEAVVKVAAGDEKTLSARRVAMMQHFTKIGAPQARVLAAIGRRSVDDITLEDMAVLRGFANAIKDGEAKIDDCFPDPKAPPPGTTKSEQTAAKLKAKNAPAPEIVQEQPAEVVDFRTTETEWDLTDLVTSSEQGTKFSLIADHVKISSNYIDGTIAVKNGDVMAKVVVAGTITDAVKKAGRLQFSGGVVSFAGGAREFTAQKVEAA